MNAAVSFPVEAPLRAKILHASNEFALTDTGKLYIAHGHDLDENVMAFKDDLRRRRVSYQTVSCSLEELRRLSSDSKHDNEGVEIRKVTPQRQEQVKEIFAAATRLRASDIHFIGNSSEDLCRVLFRVHGILEPHEAAPGKPYVVEERGIGAELRAAVYAGMSDVAQAVFRPGVPQDARMAEQYVKEFGLYGARIATCPLDKGQLMVCRLLTHMPADMTMAGLGYLPEQVAINDEMAEYKRGMVIVAGETGAGKSTTLALQMRMLIERHKGQIHVLTLEDPPENLISGANQYPIREGDWPGAIKNAMRLDPDVMMIQEIRDLPSAQAAFRAALTGHGVRTTLHANGPFSILSRLADLGLDRWQYTDPSQVRALMHQALAPVLCDECKIPWGDLSKLDWLSHTSTKQRERIESKVSGDKVFLRNPSGCRAPGCHKGHKGRTVVARVVKTTAQMFKVYINHGPMAANEHWVREEQGITHSEHLRRLIEQGKVDPILGEHTICKLDDMYD
jgi:type II secretory ATPase GspE/PulE/Tfp pilus assembly ATPase PilB-like protein